MGEVAPVSFSVGLECGFRRGQAVSFYCVFVSFLENLKPATVIQLNTLYNKIFFISNIVVFAVGKLLHISGLVHIK